MQTERSRVLVPFKLNGADKIALVSLQASRGHRNPLDPRNEYHREKKLAAESRGVIFTPPPHTPAKRRHAMPSVDSRKCPRGVGLAPRTLLKEKGFLGLFFQVEFISDFGMHEQTELVFANI